ncbi:DUF732 domain-containing protein [Mycolicibacter sp. MYC123]|uniref:DUF732 domain-containing protein n=2 Tax=Mycolicibacter TaxID=1073531 RepID=A0ABU5YFE9_9MYCO|nr:MULTISPECIES: DUF732 domain-containing protein [unclassified Mycolicibacter]MEB3048783.1 DUF732 domain-containing protein [Mycolicibacter sp. MYC123]MEB3070018.1 DUF732 domain-containing protein [Mycolicibacter sp. MYC017]
MAVATEDTNHHVAAPLQRQSIPGKSAACAIDAGQVPGHAGAQHRGVVAVLVQQPTAVPVVTPLGGVRPAAQHRQTRPSSTPWRCGLKYRQPDQAVTAGCTLCDLPDSGKVGDEIPAVLMKHNDNLSNARANTVMDIAYRAHRVSLSPKIETAVTAIEFLVERHALPR